MAHAYPLTFTLTYKLAAKILVARWLPGVFAEDLHPAFEEIVAVAKQADNCRYWLLDLRERAEPATFQTWFGSLLSREVVRELGKPVFVACLANETSRAEIESIATEARLRQQAQDEFYPYFFSDEAAARERLAYYQEHDSPPPPPQPPGQ